MKTVCKKLLTMMLVAVMLVSVIPFQAFADEVDAQADQQPIEVPVKLVIAGEDRGTRSITVNPGESFNLDANAALKVVATMEGRELGSWTDHNGNPITNLDLTYDNLVAYKNSTGEDYGMILTLNKAGQADPTPTPDPDPKPTTKKYTFVVKVDGEQKGYKEIELAEGETAESKNVQIADVFAGYDASKYETHTGWNYGTDRAELNLVTKPVEPEKPTTKTIQFIWNIGNKENEVYTTVTATIGQKITLPMNPKYSDLKFEKWTEYSDGSGEWLTSEYVVKADSPDKFYARWQSNIDDGVSAIKVYARWYVGSTYRNETHLYTVSDVEDGTQVLDWLKKNEDKTRNAVKNQNSDNRFEWRNAYYYDYTSGTQLTDQDLKLDGDKSVFVKLYTKGGVESDVLLYVHKTTKDAGTVYDLTGYMKGDIVSRDAVTAVIKDHYSGSNMKLQGLYNDTTWKQLKNGEKPSGANGLEVGDGVLKIHVLLTNATANSGSSNADSSNPKTGDSINLVMTVMGLSASALAAVYFVEKKRIAR